MGARAITWQRALAQFIFGFGAKLHRRWPSLLPMRLLRASPVKACFRKLSGSSELLTYREGDLALECYKRHWVVYSLGMYEPLTRRVLESLFQPGMVFVDGGANVGWYSLLASRRIGDAGLVHAFEPHPGAYEVLMANIGRNRAHNIKPWNVALGSGPGTAVLHGSTEPGSHTLLQTCATECYTVSVVALDDVLGDARVDIIKLDLEGSEIQALQGMEKILQRLRKPVLVIELASDWLNRAQVSAWDITEYLKAHRYRLKAIDDHQGRGPFELDAREKEAMQHCEFNYNLLCLPEDWSYDRGCSYEK